MNNTIRRLAGWLMALVMIFGSVIVPAGSGDRYALAEGDEGIVNQLQGGPEGEGEGEITEPIHVIMKRLYDLYYERSEVLKAEEGLTEDQLLPEFVLGEAWTALLPEDQALLRLLLDGAWEFVYDDLGAVIGVQEHVFEIEIPTDAAEQTTPPPAQGDSDPAGDVPEVTFVDSDLVTNPPANNDNAGNEEDTVPGAAEGSVTYPAAGEGTGDGNGADDPVVDGATVPDAVTGSETEEIPEIPEIPVTDGSETLEVPEILVIDGSETLDVEEIPVTDGSDTLEVPEDLVIDGSDTLEVEEDLVTDGSETLEVIEDVVATGSETLNVPEDEVIDGSKTQDIVDEGKGGEEVPGAEPEVIPAGNEDKTEEAPKATGLKATRFALKKAPALQAAPDANDGNGNENQARNLSDPPATDDDKVTVGSYSYTISPSTIQYNANAASFTVALFKDNKPATITLAATIPDTETRIVPGTPQGNAAGFTIKASTETPVGNRADTYNVTVTPEGETTPISISFVMTPATFTQIVPSTSPVEWTGSEIEVGKYFDVKASSGNTEFTVPQSDLSKVFIPSSSSAASTSDVGTHTYKITTSNNNITGIPENTTVSFEVKYNLAKANVTLASSSADYTGESITATISKVEIPAPTPVDLPAADYSVSYKKGDTVVPEIKDPGKYSVILTGQNNAYNSTSATFTVSADLTYELTGTTTIYNGRAQQPTASFKANGHDITLNSESYTLQYKAQGGTGYLPASETFPKDSGTYDVKLVLNSDAAKIYDLTDTDSVKEKGFTITQATLTYDVVVGSKTYNRGTQTTELTFKSGDTTVSLATSDYTLSYVGITGFPQNADIYTPTVTLNNHNYVISPNQPERKFEITKAVISTAALNPATKVADGTTDWKNKIVIGSTNTAEVIQLIVTTSGSPALELRDDEIEITSSSSMVQVGSYTVTYAIKNTAANNFEASSDVLEVPFTVTARPITAEWKADPANSDKVTYNQTNQRTTLQDSLVVKDGEAIVNASSYTVEVKKDNTVVEEVKDAGTYSVTVTGNTGTPYAGATIATPLTFTVVPAVVDSWTLDCKTATYDRTDWKDNFYLNGNSAPADQPVKISATATGAENTQNKDSVALTLTATDGLAGLVTSEMINAGEYTDKITVTVSSNYSVKGTAGGTFNVPFSIVPAEVDEMALAYGSATYDRHDWKEDIYLNGDKKTGEYPNVITGTAKGAEGTVNKDLVLDLSVADNDFAKDALTTVEMLNADDYEVKVKVSDNFSFGGKAGETISLPFTVVPAEVEMALAYSEATYNRKDWAENIYLNGDKETGEYPNIITGTATGVEGTVNKDMVLTLSVKDDDFAKDPLTVGEMIDAGEYKENIEVQLTDNFAVDGNKDHIYTMSFQVNPAEIDSAALDYNSTFYDRHDWHGELLTFDQKKDEPVAYNNVLTIKTKPVKYGSTVSDEVLTLNEQTEDMEKAADEYEIKAGTMKDAGSYNVEWSLKDADNFVVADARKDVLQKLPFTVDKAEITAVTIKRDDGDAGTSATVVYDGADWRDRTDINSYDKEKHHHYFVVKATTASKTVPGTSFIIGALTLTGSEYDLSDATIIRIGDYNIQANLDDTKNFFYSAALDLEGEKTGTSPYVLLPFEVTRYEAEPIRDTTVSVVGPSKSSVVKYKSVYRMGPEQDGSARILKFRGEPGEEVIVTIGGETVRTTFSGTKYSNYGGGSTPGELTLKISSSGVVTIDRTSTTVKLTPNSDTTITLSYADAGNLKEGSEEKDPSALSVKVHFDTEKPKIEDAVDTFHNRDMTVSITVPEAGRLESISFDETISVESKDYVSESENYGATFKDTLDVPWNTEGDPHLIHSGDKAIEMKYTDLVYNTASAKFNIEKSTGAPIIITVEPIVSADKERIDMDERPEQVKVTVEGTGYEPMHLTFEPSKSDEAKDTATGTGVWAQESTGEWSTIVETDAFSNDYDITATAWYDDLANAKEVYTFFFDNVADPIILTVPEITEDNWVIPGIAESNSAVEIKVDGEKIVTKGDRFTLFTGRKPQLAAGSKVQIVATDLSNNRANLELEVQPSPTDGMQTLDAYAMGKIYTDAHTTKEEPKWLMAGLYTEEELTNGVSVPLVAGAAFHIGEVQLKMEGGKLNSVFTPKEGVTLSGQKVTAQIATSRAFDMESFNAGEKKNAENAVGYWISAYVQAKVPVEMLHQTFQLDESQAEVRSFYFNRQRLEKIPE